MLSHQHITYSEFITELIIQTIRFLKIFFIVNIVISDSLWHRSPMASIASSMHPSMPSSQSMKPESSQAPYSNIMEGYFNHAQQVGRIFNLHFFLNLDQKLHFVASGLIAYTVMSPVPQISRFCIFLNKTVSNINYCLEFC